MALALNAWFQLVGIRKPHPQSTLIIMRKELEKFSQSKTGRTIMLESNNSQMKREDRLVYQLLNNLY